MAFDPYMEDLSEISSFGLIGLGSFQKTGLNKIIIVTRNDSKTIVNVIESSTSVVQLLLA